MYVCNYFSNRIIKITWDTKILADQSLKLEKESSDLISQQSIYPLLSCSDRFACSSPSIADFFQPHSSFCLKCPFSYYFSSPKTTGSLKFCSRGWGVFPELLNTTYPNCQHDWGSFLWVPTAPLHPSSHASFNLHGNPWFYLLMVLSKPYTHSVLPTITGSRDYYFPALQMRK